LFAGIGSVKLFPRSFSPLVLFWLELTGFPRHSIKHPEPENLKTPHLTTSLRGEIAMSTATSLPANRIRSNFVKTTRDQIVYREQDASYGDDGDEVRTSVGSVFFAANQTETKKLNGRNVEAVLFTIGSSPGWFWMPKTEFVQSTEPHDIKKQTGIPHQP
jgi:hypothetical protein